MCGLCGALGTDTHWADGASTAPAARRAARRAHVALGNAILRPHGLTLSDWQGTAFVLRSRTGATTMVSSLGDLWAKADMLGTGRADPLDPTLLDALGG